MRLFFRIFPIIAVVAMNACEEPTVAKELDREIKTYMSFGLPVDPAKVFTLVDLDLSYALASTLVDWSDSKEVISGLADRWDPPRRQCCCSVCLDSNRPTRLS